MSYAPPVRDAREFAEDGRRERESHYTAGELDGIRRVLHRNGKPASEETYAKGSVRKLRCRASDGKLQLEEEYFEDGSRKSGPTGLTSDERARLCRPET